MKYSVVLHWTTMSHSDVFKKNSVKLSPIWFLGLYSLQTFISNQNWQCHHSQSHHWHHWLLTSSWIAWSGQPCRMHHLVDLSFLSQDFFQSTPHGFFTDKFWNQLIVYNQYCAIKIISIPKMNSSLSFWKVTVWLCHCVTWIWMTI